MAYVKKYDVDFSKRKFIENTAAGFLKLYKRGAQNRRHNRFQQRGHVARSSRWCAVHTDKANG